MLACASPLSFFMVSLSLVACTACWAPAFLLAAAVVCNVILWAWTCTKAALAILGAMWTSTAVHRYSQYKKQVPSRCKRGVNSIAAEEQARSSDIGHLIVIPNYAEDEELLAQTLSSLAEAEGAKDHFRVVLAMEAREGPEGLEKASRLRTRFSERFQSLTVTSHPLGLAQVHRDGSLDPEVPGKASNLKFAVEEAYDGCRTAGVNTDRVVLTVADADCIFHPGYFAHVSRDAEKLLQTANSEFMWSVWQAPQVPFRNFWAAPVCSRVWGYIAAVYEFGGVTGTTFGFQHLLFSGYSLPLHLALRARAWDGDGLAEDHHCFLRCLFYSVGELAAWSTEGSGEEGRPNLVKMRPVMLPVKSTSVVSHAGYCQTWVDRWYQARRHAAGVAELSYFLLAVGSYVRHVPFRALQPCVLWELSKVFTGLFCIHLLPLLQAIMMLGVLTSNKYHNILADTPTPDSAGMEAILSVGFVVSRRWAFHWMVFAPFFFFFFASIVVISVVFLRPSLSTPSREDDVRDLWHAEHSGTPPICGSHHASLVFLVAFDFAVCLAPIMVPYGLMVSLIACIHVCVWGNRTQYVTAAKALCSKLSFTAHMKEDFGQSSAMKLSSYGSIIQRSDRSDVVHNADSDLRRDV